MRNLRTFRLGWSVLGLPLLIAAVTCVTACSSSGDGSDGGGSKPTIQFLKSKKPPGAPKSVAVQKPGEENLADMVSAVTPNKGGSPLQVKFVLVQKPEVGQPLDVDVAVVLGQPLPDAVSVAFQASDGLEIVEGADAFSLSKPAEGMPIRRTVKLLPQKDGIFAVNAVVTLTQPHDSPVRTFAIPIIAGRGTPELAARADTAAKADGAAKLDARKGL
jgi:hypothetical protein